MSVSAFLVAVAVALALAAVLGLCKLSLAGNASDLQHMLKRLGSLPGGGSHERKGGSLA